MLRALLLAAAFLTGGSAVAQQATGLWLREDGESQVRIAPCGASLCGFVAWVKDPDDAKDIGLKVFFDMQPAGSDVWEGQAFNPEDEKTYTGKMVPDDDNLKTSGCVFGGLICETVNWKRLR